MSKKDIVHVSGRYSIGCTFLDWSLHWLSGKNDVLTINSKIPTPIVDNPITAEIAHGHAKNHPYGVPGTSKVVKYLENSDYNELITVYWMGGKITHEIKDYLQYRQKSGEVAKAFAEVWEWISSQGYPGIWIDFTGPKMYMDISRTVQNHFGVAVDSKEEALKQWVDFQFPYTLENVSNPQIWDYREAYALCVRPLENKDFSVDINRSYPHYWIDFIDWINNGEYHIKEIMKFLNKPIKEDRWNHWVDVYKQWAKKSKDIVHFANNVEDIVEDIVKGNYRKLGNLSIHQEGIIQHLLIYKHDLNLKTWELKRFPDNTQDLHKLLEPNIHNVENIYDR